MDTRDTQDNQDGMQEYEKLALAMIVCGVADARGKGVAGSNSQILYILFILCIDVN